MIIRIRLLPLFLLVVTTCVVQAQEKKDVDQNQTPTGIQVEQTVTGTVPKEEVISEPVAQKEVEPKVAEKEPAQPVEKKEIVQPVEAEVPTEPKVETTPEIIPVVEPKVEPKIQPEQPEEKKEVIKPADQETEIVGIDTVDLDEPQGNWLFKRIWWERAESQYEKVRTRVEAVLESRMQFFAQRAELDKTVLDPFYITIGLGQGELQTILSELIERLQQEREQEGVLSPKEREFLKTLRTQKSVLEQMSLDVQAINKIDREIDESLNKLLEQINRVRGYERDAWRYFKDIARVLSDKKAREIFYKMDTVYKNITKVEMYIKQAFKDHFDQLITTARQQVDRVQTAMQALKEKGIDFKKQLVRMEQEEEPELVKKPEKEEEIGEEQVPGGFWNSYVMAPLKTMWGGIVYVIRLPIDMFIGGPGVEEYEDDE